MSDVIRSRIKRYRKKPVEILALQWDGTNERDIHAFCEGKASYVPMGKFIQIITLEGTMLASVDDYIIRGLAGEFYPCKLDIFHNSYELVE